MDAIHPNSSSAAVLRLALRVLQPLVRWLLRSGVGHAELANALKPVFLDEALREGRRIGARQTDSAVSLLSGLHRKDVKALSAATQREAPAVERVSLPTQVVARWLATGLPDALPLANAEPCFEALVRSVSTDVHPRAVQDELLRLGVAQVRDGVIRLCQRGFLPDPQAQETRELLASGVADHLAAGVHNLTGDGQRKYLEQTVFADGLSKESARALELLANRLWNDAMTAMISAAVPLCEHDEPRGGDQRIRLGMYCFAEAMAPGDEPPARADAPTPIDASTKTMIDRPANRGGETK